MKRLAGILLVLSGLTSCIDSVELPIRSEKPQLVVDGLITNEPPPYSVRLSYSGTFKFDGENPLNQKVQGATVTIRDDKNRSTVLRETAAGTYQTADSGFIGQPGRTYTLNIKLLNGPTYISKPEQLPEVPPIDTITAEFVSLQGVIGSYLFDFFIDTTDPASGPNFYRWTSTVYHAQNWVRCGASDNEPWFWAPISNQTVNIASDQGINGNKLRKQLVIRSPIYSIGPHFVEAKQYSLTQSAFQFWKLFKEQQSRTGTIFDPLPASLVGNITNSEKPDEPVLGFFGASAVTVKRLRYYPVFTKNAVLSYLESLERTGYRGNCWTPGYFPLKINPPGF
jgi:hypothetical protein